MKKSKNNLISNALIALLFFVIAIVIIIAICFLVKQTIYQNVASVEGSQSDWIVEEEEEEETVEVQPTSFSTTDEAMEYLKKYAKQNNYNINAYPEKACELMVNSPDAIDFVLDYPAKKGCENEAHLEEYENSKTVPLFIQWDDRWGYANYGDEGTIGFNGCGVTCLSMVAFYLTGNTQYSPIYMARYAEKNNYYVSGSGTTWQLFNEGVIEFGLKSTNLLINESALINAVEKGDPVIVNVGPGDFTTTGHYIVITGYKNGEFTVNDPNSTINSSKKWDWQTLKPQIKNMWQISKEQED